MRFLITLQSVNKPAIIPINYQYPLSAAIYKILQRADEKYAEFLHEKGYGKGFKLFTFSDLKCRFEIRGDRLSLLTPQAQMILSFHLPLAAETFIRGIFLSQEMVIADKKSKTTFEVVTVEALPPILRASANEQVNIILNPISPVVCGEKNEKGNYRFLSPEEENYSEMILLNWKEKCKTIYGDFAEELMAGSYIKPEFYHDPPKSRLVTIKAGTDAETKIRGFMNFKLAIGGKKEAVELLIDSGVGLYNAMGMGAVGALNILSSSKRE